MIESGGGIGSVVGRERIFELSDGRKLVLSQVTLKDFSAAQEESLRSYRRAHVRAASDIADLAGDRNLVETAISQALEFTHERLPKKAIKMRRIVKGRKVVETVQADYAVWWMSETADGQLFMVWRSLRKAAGQEGITIDEVDAMFTDRLQKLAEAASEVAEISDPTVLDVPGNVPGSTTPPAPGLTNRQRREQRRARRRLAEGLR